MDYKARLTLDTSQHDDAIKKSAKQVNDYDAKVKQTGTDVRKLIAEERKAARERAIANKHYQDMARSFGDFSKGLTGGIGVLGKFTGALAIGTTAAKVFTDAFMSSETNIDQWEKTVTQAQSSYNVFVNTLNNGNWSNFFTNLRNAIKGAGELAEVLDRLGSIKTNNMAAETIQRARIAELRRRKENGENVDDELKAAEKELEELLKARVAAGKEAGKKTITQTLEEYNGALSAISDSVAEQIITQGQKYFDEQAAIYNKYKSLRNDFDYTYDEYGAITSKNPVFNYDKLSDAQKREYDIAKAVTEGETKLGKGISQYNDALLDEESMNRELLKVDKARKTTTTKATTTTDKLSDEEKELQNALDRFKKSIKSAQMKMSALKVWSGITNMSEIDVLEDTIKINDDTISGYYDKLKNVGELTEDETKELKQLIETQKGYRRKLSKLKVEEEERRTNGDFSSLRRGVQSINDVIKQSWDKYINNLQGTELFNVWNNGKTHVNNRYGREDSELIEDYYNDIYEYIKNIEESRKDVSSHFKSMTENPFKVNDPEFISKYQNIVDSVQEFLTEYESKNGSNINLNKFVSEYWEKHLTEQTDLIDQVIFDAIIKTLYKKREIKNTPDSETLYNMADSLLGRASLIVSLTNNGGNFTESIDKKYKEYIEKLLNTIDGDDVAKAFVEDIASGIQNINVGRLVENDITNRFGVAIRKSINEQLKEIDWKKYDLSREQIAVWQNGTDVVRNFAGAWQSFTETMEDDDASGLEKFFAMQDAINSTIDSIFSLIDGYKRLQEVEESFVTITKQQNQLSKEAIALNTAESQTKEVEAASASKAAIAEGTEKAVSTSSHWIEAIAAISAVVAAITAALALSGSFSQGGIVQKFADGGVFSGNRSVGDYNIARVNSGEMILNGSQQAKLFHLLDGTGGFANNQPSGEVTFRIQGDTLIGVLNNYNKKRSKII